MKHLHVFQCVLYSATILLVGRSLLRMKSQVDASVTWDFKKFLTVASLIAFSFFPVVLNLMVVNLLISCKDQITNGTNVTSTAIITESASDVLASLLVFLCTKFLIIKQFTKEEHKCFFHCLFLAYWLCRCWSYGLRVLLEK